MEERPLTEQVKKVLDIKKNQIKARLFVTRLDGIAIYDSIQNHTSTSVSALVSGVWQASETLISLITKKSDEIDFRLAFDTSSQGVYLLPLILHGKKYLLGAIYDHCMNPGQLKRQVSQIREELELSFKNTLIELNQNLKREGYLFQDISDKEMDNLFSMGGF